jgi:hypothetical protein
MFMGDVVDIGAPSSDTVSTATIQDDAVTAAKLANSINTEITANTAKTGITSGQASAITANTAKVTNATHTGDVTGATALTIAVDAVDIAMLSATGTASATTFLRGDNAWASAGGDNTPAFAAYLGTTITGTTTSAWTKLAFNTEDFDTDSAYDNSTNYRFTVPSGEGGKYHAQTTIMFQNGNADGETASVGIYVNGSQYALSEDTGTGSYGWENTATTCVATLTLSAADYVEVFYYTKSQNGGGTPHLGGGSARPTRFSMHKLIGV